MTKTVDWNDVVTEFIWLVAAAAAFVYSVKLRNRFPELGTVSWGLIVTGLVIFTAGNAVDVVDEFAKPPVLIRVVWERGSRLVGLLLVSLGLFSWVRAKLPKGYVGPQIWRATYWDRLLFYSGLLWLFASWILPAYSFASDPKSWGPLDEPIGWDEVILKWSLVVLGLAAAWLSISAKRREPLLQSPHWNNFSFGLIVFSAGSIIDTFHEVGTQPPFVKDFLTSPTQALGTVIIALALGSWISKVSVPAIRRNLQLTQSRIGIGIIDERIAGGYPRPSTTLLLGDPGSGKTVLCNQFVSSALKKDWAVVYFTLESPPGVLFTSVAKLSQISPEDLRKSLLVVDGYSFRAGMKSDQELSVTSLSPSDLLISLSQGMQALRASREVAGILVCWDSLNPMFNELDHKTVLRFLSMFVAKILLQGAMGIMTVTRSGLIDPVRPSVETLVDAVIDLSRSEDQAGIRYYLTIKKIRGIAFDGSPKRFHITETGIIEHR